MPVRPLAATRTDQRRFVNRVPEVERTVGALTASQNVLVLGEPGSGRSTLLNRVAYRLESKHAVDPLVVGGEAANDAAQLLGILVARVRRLDGGRDARTAWLEDLRALAMPDGPFGQVVQPALLMELVDLLAEAVSQRERPVCLMVDGLAPEVAHAVFGTLRNELWAIEAATWVLAGETADGSLYREPPADAFFPVTVELGPLTDIDAHRLLAGHGETVTDSELSEILAAGAGNPRHLLRAAADMSAGLPLARSADADQTRRAEALAGPLAGRLVEYLAERGPATASDARMLRHLGASRQRASELMHQLQDAGVLESSEQHRPGQPGRPGRRFAIKATS